MGFEFKGMGDEVKPAVTTTTLSVNNQLVGEHAVATIVEENLTQDIFAEGEEEQLAIEFLEENGLYAKFLLWCGIKEQLKNLKLSLATPTE
jgi:hypothetical protein